LILAALAPLAACARGDAAPGAPASNPAAAAPAPATAASAPQAAVDGSDPRVALAAKIPGTRPEDLRATPVPGIYELTHGADITYVSADAAYVFAGDLYRVSATGEFPNLSESRRRELRLKMLAGVPESQMLVFGPAKARHTISVFTDIDCPWCQRLHSEIAEYNKLGIRVRYLFYPRTGPATESWEKAEAVWCAKDRNEAFTRAKRGEGKVLKACAGSPVARECQLARDIGVTGTPGIVLDNGELVPGYLSPAQMLAHIQNSAAEDLAAAQSSK
jgi:thiol:disulfide interchange protein DsbC